jgi:hypothetical protein
MDWRTDLPMNVSENGDDENDFDYDDGDIYFFATVDGDRLVIHDLIAKDEANRQGRSGLGRRICETLRPYFGEIVASGVGEYPAEIDIEQQKPFLFWKAMLDEGLIDMIIKSGGNEIARKDSRPSA